MLKRIAIVAGLVASVVLTAFARQSEKVEEDTSDSLIVPRETRITLDLGRFTVGMEEWHPSFSIRVGYGSRISDPFYLSGYVDYYTFDLVQLKGHSYFMSTSAKRHDLAVYAGLRAFSFFEIDLGAYYTTSNQAWGKSPLFPSNPPSPWRYSGFSEVRLFVQVGMQYDIPITKSIILPIGFYYRDLYGSVTIEVYARVGLGWRH